MHKGRAYPGLHEAIVGPELWDMVQVTFGENRIQRTEQTNGASRMEPVLLTGLVFDAAGQRMTPTHANKQGRRYRYYVSSSLVRGSRKNAPNQAVRVPASDLEKMFEGRLCTLLRDEAAIYQAVSGTGADVRTCKRLLAGAAILAERWTVMPSAEKREMLQAIVARVTVSARSVDIEVDLAGLLGSLQDNKVDGAGPERTSEMPTTILSVPAELTRTGQEMQMLIHGPAENTPREPDRNLVRMLAQAQQFRDMVMQGQGRAMGDLATDAGVSASYFTSIVRLGFLAPEITQSILQGKQPATLTANRLKLIIALDPSWSEQRRQVGFR